MSESFSEGLVKAVIDVQQEIMAIDSELHADLERMLIENGSRQENLWGINLYPDLEDESLRKAILNIVGNLIQE